MSKPKVTALSKEKLDALKDADFYPNRQKKEDNTSERMDRLFGEANRLFKHSKTVTPKKEDFPNLYNELPTLWAMIEEGKFKYWDPKDQGMLKMMINVTQKSVKNEMTFDEAEKNAGAVLASRFLPANLREPGNGQG